MGVQPRPIPTTGNDHACWAPGLTPDVIKVFVAGVDYGDKWSPGDGNPPNAYFDMIRQGPNSSTWKSAPVFPSAQLKLQAGRSELICTSSTGILAFYKLYIPEECKKYYASVYTKVNFKFYGGNAWATGYDFPWEIAELVMNAYWNDPNYECFPMDNEQLAIRVARISDGTNIYIKFDHTL